MTAASDRTIRVRSTTTAELLTTLEGHADAGEDARFGLDGKRVVSVSADGSVLLWDGSK